MRVDDPVELKKKTKFGAAQKVFFYAVHLFLLI